MAEPWIRVHANLVGKPVIDRAVEQLGVNVHEAMGLMVQFWGAVSQHVVGGLIGDRSDTQIERWAGWTRRRGRFAEFIRQHHVDAEGRVNEWLDYAGNLESRREKERDKKRRQRGTDKGRPADVPAPVPGDIPGDVPRDVPPLSVPARANETKRYETSSTNTLNQSAGDAQIDAYRALADSLASDADRAALAEVVKGARSAVACIASLGGMLNGLNVQHAPTAAQLGAALQDYAANGPEWNVALFRGYVDRAIAAPPNGAPPKASRNGVHPDLRARARSILELAKRYDLLRWIPGDDAGYHQRERDAAADPRAGDGFLEEIAPLKLHMGIGDQANDHFAVLELERRMHAAGQAT